MKLPSEPPCTPPLFSSPMTSGCSWWSRTMSGTDSEEAESKLTSTHVPTFSEVKPDATHASGGEKEDYPDSRQDQWPGEQKDFSSHIPPQIGSPSLTSLYSGSSEGAKTPESTTEGDEQGGGHSCPGEFVGKNKRLAVYPITTL